MSFPLFEDAMYHALSFVFSILDSASPLMYPLLNWMNIEKNADQDQ